MIDPMLSLAAASLATMLAAASVMVMLRTRRKMRIAEELTAFMEKQIDDLETIVSKLRENDDVASQRLSEHSRQITWLQSRARRPTSLGHEVIDDTPATETPRLNMTERRHRVTALASRGQNVESIAKALAMLPGEVELIMDIQRASLQVR